MFMGSYRGTSSATFGIHETIEECKIDCENHAKNNSRKRGTYSINEGFLVLGNLFGCDYSKKRIEGIKKSKNIEWSDTNV